MEGSNRASDAVAGLGLEERPKPNGVRLKKEDMSDSATPNSSKFGSRGPSMSPDDTKSAADSAPISENGTAPKLSRKPSQKMSRSPPPLFDHLPDATGDACSTFQVINDCLYGSRNMGSSDHDALDCDCAEDWRKLPSRHLPPPPQRLGDVPAPNTLNFPPLQATARTTPAAKTRTASTGQRKSSVSMATAIAGKDAKTNGSSANSMPKSRS